MTWTRWLQLRVRGYLLAMMCAGQLLQSDDCEAVCQHAPPFSNGAANKFACFDALHFYKNRPSLGDRTGPGATEHTAPAGEGKVRFLPELCASTDN